MQQPTAIKPTTFPSDRSGRRQQMFGMRSQFAPNVRVVQDHSESLIGCADSAGDYRLTRASVNRHARHFLGGEQGRHKTYDHRLLTTRARTN